MKLFFNQGDCRDTRFLVKFKFPPLLPFSSGSGELFRVCVIGKSSCHHLLPIWFCRNRFVACSVSHTTTAPPQNGGKGTQCYSTIGIDCNMLSLAMHNTCDTSIWRRSFFKLIRDTVFMKEKFYHFSAISQVHISKSITHKTISSNTN